MNMASFPEPPQAEDNLSLVDLLTSLGEQKRIFIAVTLIGSVLSLIVAFWVPRFYTATTVLLPPQQQQSAAAGALAQLGSLAGLAGSGIKTPDEMYVALFSTRRLQDVLIQRFKLQERYEAKNITDARLGLEKRVYALADKKTGLITLSVDDLDPDVAAKLANAHVEELQKLLSTMAVTEAQQRRMFFDQQVTKTKDLLSAAELKFRKLQSENGLVVADVLAQSGMRAGVELRSQIALKEVQLQAMGRFATPLNPQKQQLAAELAALKQQLTALEEGGQSVSGSTHGSEAVRAYRDMKVHEAALEALIRQFEIAKLDEAREGPLLQQIDAAVSPEYPSKPRRSLIALGGGMFSMVIGAIWAIGRSLVRRMDREAVSRLKNAWT